MSTIGSYARVLGTKVIFHQPSFGSINQARAFADIFSTSLVSARIDSFAQRAGESLGDLIGKIFDTTAWSYSFVLASLSYSTVSISGPWTPMTIRPGDPEYSWPGIGSVVGAAFKIPAEILQDVSGDIYLQLVISWNAPAAFNGHPTLENGCIGYWKLDDDAPNSDLIDSVGSAVGTLQLVGGGAPRNTEVYTAEGKIDKGIDFVKSTAAEADLSALEVSPGDVFNLSKSFSVTFWVKFSSLGSTTIVIGSSLGTLSGFRIQLGVSTRARLNFYMGTSSNNWLVYTSYIYNLDTWYHVTLTYDGLGSIVGMGLLVDGYPVIFGTTITGSGALDIDRGVFKAMMQTPGGEMDEIGVWDRVLSEAEIYGLVNGLLTY